jgi:hypothetical protein
MKSVFPVIALLFLLTANSELQVSHGFTRPDFSHPVMSPSGNYEVVNINLEDVPQGADPHKLILKTRNDGRVVWSHPYLRSIDLSWSTVGDVLAINDYAFSNYTECILITAKGRTVTQRNLAKKFLATHKSLKLDQYIHVHIQALRWLTPYQLRIEVRAWASPTIPGWIDKQYTFDMRSGFD